MNRIQQEALAKAVGMSREELAASLVEREALQQIGVKDAVAAKVKFDLLVKEKGYAAAVAELGDDQYANQLKQQSIQERFNQSVEKLKEIFISIAEPVLKIVSPLVDLVTNVLPLINFILTPALATITYIGDSISGWLTMFDGGLNKLTTMQKIVGFIGTAIIAWKAGMVAYNAYQAVAAALTASTAAGAMSTAAALTLGLGLATIIGGIIIGVGAIKSASKDAASGAAQVRDGEINSNGGLVVSKFEKGQLQPVAQGIKEDNVIFTTNKVKQNNSTSQNSQQDLSPLLEEMRALRQEQSRSNSKPIIVDSYTDSTKTGTATAMRKVKIQ